MYGSSSPLRAAAWGSGSPAASAAATAAAHFDAPAISDYYQIVFPRPRKTGGASIPCRVNASCTAVGGDRVYAFGGFHFYSDEVYNDVFVLSMSDLIWKRVDYIKGRGPCKRCDHTATLWGQDRLIIFGGRDANDEFLNDLFILNLTSLEWSEPETFGPAPSGRGKHSSVIYQDRLYIYGEFNSQDNQVAGELNILDLRLMQWNPEPIPVAPRHSHFCTAHKNRLYIYGGMTPSMDPATNLLIVDLSDYVQTSVSVAGGDTPPTLGQHFAQLCGERLVVGGAVVVPGRGPGEGSMPVGIWSLSLDGLRWRRHDDGRYLGSAASWHYFAMGRDQSRMLLFGDGNGLNDGDEDAGVVSFNGEFVNDSEMLDYDGFVANRASLGRQRHGTDLTILSRETSAPPLRVHRLVLLTRWPHFAAIERSGMAETSTRPSSHQTIFLDEPHRTVRGFIRYLYTDTVDQLRSLAVVADLLVLADLYCMDRLRRLCSARLHRDLSVRSAIRTYVAAHRAGERGLKARALRFCLDRFGAVARTAGFRWL
ncbi:hypothetical protein DFJ73DRAFT_632322, partial [Zopfochytrium polystomum]